MVKFSLVIAAAVTLVFPVSAPAKQAQKHQLVEYSSEQLPPSDYRGQWWTSPEKCQYSRAGRPGETVWYLIVNSAHMKCPSRLIQRAYSDYK